MRNVISPARTLGAIALIAATTACASTGSVPRPFPMPGGTDPRTAGGAPADAGTDAGRPTAGPYALVGTALDLRGVPYRNGGADPRGFDCSGFTQYVFAQHGIALPREVRDQYEMGERVRPEELQPGDLLFFATTARDASHVAIAVGGDQFVHAPSSTGAVRVERLGSEYWSRRFLGARRVM